MIPFTNDEITALLCEISPAARILAESKAESAREAMRVENEATLRAFPDAVVLNNNVPWNVEPTANMEMLAPDGSGE